MSASDPLDFYDVGALLGDDERLIRDTVGRFVDREVTPIIADCFAAERFPVELVPRLADSVRKLAGAQQIGRAHV